MGDTKVKEEVASEENVDSPMINGTILPDKKENTEEVEETKEGKEKSENEKSLPTEMEVDEDSKLSSDEKEVEAVSSEDTPSVSKRKSRSSRSSSSTTLPPNESPNRKEDENSEEEKEDLSVEKVDVEGPSKRMSVDSDSEEGDFKGFETPLDTDRCYILIKALSQIVESLSKKEEYSDDFMGFDSDTSDLKSRNDVDGTDSVSDSTVNENEYTEGLLAPVPGSKKTPRSVKKSVNVDLSNPEFRKPFECGWVRELVYRSTSDSSMRRNADIYYYTPTGKKVRSSREILEHLSGTDLTLENFTFFKEPIGLNDPVKEIIREAKSKPGPRGTEESTPSVKKLTPKVKLTTPSTPVSSTKYPPKESGKGSFTPKVVFKGNAAQKGRPNASKNKLDKKRKSAGPDDVDIIMDSAEWSPDQKINPTRDVCSIECRLAMGLIPTLQCHKCLCLYHPECVGLQKEKLKPSYSYTCKNCQVMKSPPPPVPTAVSMPNKMSTLLPPPPLTPIAPSNRGNRSTEVPSSGPPASLAPPSSPVGGRSGCIVGAVTTWLAPSSSIQVASQDPSMASTDTPQGVVSLNGRPFLYLPKQNVVNVVNSQQAMIDGGGVSNPPGLFLVPCDPPPPKPLGAKNGESTTTQLTNGVKRPLDEDDCSPPPEKRQRTSDSQLKQNQRSQSPDVSSQSSIKEDGPNFMQNLNAGFIGLLHTFQYLKVYELLKAACVSRMWNFVASHNTLWETVRMKNSKVRDWNGFGKTLLKHGTRTLDLRKMIVPDTIEEQTQMWEGLCDAVKNVKTLTRVDMGRCTTTALTMMAEAAPQLKSLVSLAINWKDRNSSSGSQRRRGANELDLKPFSKLTDLTELKLKAAQNGIEIKNFECLKELKNLTTLALTTVKNLDGVQDYLPTGLVSLELGECSTLSPDLATKTLPTLTNLKRLRLEKGQNDCPTIALLNAVAGLPNLVQLELINFDVKPGFDKALAKCTNIQTLLIIPTYVTQSATTNHVVMGGVAKLSHSLNYFIWGLTLELLKVTDLFIGQVENQKGNKPVVPKKGSGDSIPILKPAHECEPKEGGQPSQVDILALPNLQRVLTTLLPKTKIKILKVPFSATWRQTVTDA